MTQEEREEKHEIAELNDQITKLGNEATDYQMEIRRLKMNQSKIWNDACEAMLEEISKGFAANMHKADFNDQPVFQAIAETIKNFPKPKNPYEQKDPS